MSDNLKVLGQSAPAATTETVLYTVPDMTQTTISSIVICNRNNSNHSYDTNRNGTNNNHTTIITIISSINVKDTRPAVFDTVSMETGPEKQRL